MAVLSGFPQSWKKSCHGKSWKSRGNWEKKIKSWKFKKVMEKSWNFFTASGSFTIVNINLLVQRVLI